MQNKIIVLDDTTINKISAGEVVERPSSVVKELVENSIDAGSTQISVKLTESRNNTIQVIDNGCGMSSEDMLRSLQAHATSKIRSIEDLLKLTSLGFRGEALAAIAVVSKLTMISKQKGEVFGYKLKAIGGKMQTPEEIGCPEGTSITVDDLFFNTPARKKFLKSFSVEAGQISVYLTRLSISSPHIAFTFSSKGRLLLKTNGNGDLTQTIASVYGNDLVDKMIPIGTEQYIETEGYTLSISGLISDPSYSRPNRQHYIYFVNGRWVKSAFLSACIDEAYHTLLPNGRYPTVFLFFTVPTYIADINIHPSKLEVKFTDERMLKTIVIDAVVSALKNAQSLSRRPFLYESGKVSSPFYTESLTLKEELTPFNHTPGSTAFMQEALQYNSRITTHDQTNEAAFLPNQHIESWRQTYDIDDYSETSTEKRDRFNYRNLTVIGQAGGLYIIAANEFGIYIIDQHAAAERAQYEYFMKKASTVDSQATEMLAIPQRVDLTVQESFWLTNAIVELADLGFLIEHFGNNTFIIRGVPLWYGETNAAEFLLDIINIISEDGDYKKQLFRNNLILMACKRAIKANKYLTDSDICDIFVELDKYGSPSTCPHGRPIFIKTDYVELAKKFLRTK